MTAASRLVHSPAQRLSAGRPLTLGGVADGAEGLVLADLARAIAAREKPPAISLAVVCRDGPRMATLHRALAFFAPDIEILEFPAWDCLPYDRVSPHAAVVAARMMTLARLAAVTGREHPAILLTTVNAILQRVPRACGHGSAIAVGRARQYPADGRHHRLARSQWFQSRLDGARARRLCGARRHHRSVRRRHGRAGAARFLRRHAGIDQKLRSGNAAHRDRAARARPRADVGIPAHQRHHTAVSHRLCRCLRRRDA